MIGASVNFNEEGAYEVAQILLKKNVGVEAGVCDANAAERFVDSGLASRCLRVLLEPQEQETDQARVTVREIKEVLDRAKIDIPYVLHGTEAARLPWAESTARIMAHFTKEDVLSCAAVWF